MQVAIVEDDPIIAKAVSAAVSAAGHECRWFPDGSVAGKDLGLEAMDSRILSMLLILRKLSRESQHHDATEMHIIAENFMDQTASLAVVPQASYSHEPDFVNTVAIKSRSLAMTLAYPEIQVPQHSYSHQIPQHPLPSAYYCRSIGCAC